MISCNTTLSTRVMPAEWEPQDAILLAWPHCGTDWSSMLDQVQACYKQVAAAILKEMKLIVVTPCVEEARQQLLDVDNSHNIIFKQLNTNDTWARDFGPIAVIDDGNRLMLDFKFDAWGMKFAACHDNLICRALASDGMFSAQLVNYQDFVLEGGSIESDGHGTIMTTSRCLLSPNRNSTLTQAMIEKELCSRLGAQRVLWLDHGELAGDDTDAHIDTLARLAPNNTIIYVRCDNPADEQYEQLQLMEMELKQFKNALGQHFNLVPLPCPEPIVDEDNERLPATYANYLVTNNQVIVPTYGQPNKDRCALDTIKQVYSSRDVVGIDCNALIKQHGSLHCITMQIPKNFLKK